MNVASKELCQELYEVSGWNDTDYNYEVWRTDTSASEVVYKPVIDLSQYTYDYAYDLGYILRKIDKRIHVFVESDDEQWRASEAASELIDWNSATECYADTPEDAACKLAIELFKQGVLKHE